MAFSVEDIRLLLEVERQMDSGETPYIYVEGSTQRAAMRPALMTALGLVVGQTVSRMIWGEILRLNLEHCEQQIAYERGKALIAEVELEGC